MHMNERSRRLCILLVALVMPACSDVGYPLHHYAEVYTRSELYIPPAAAGQVSPEVERGRYLVQLTGCGACHTDGALIGEPNAARLLAGSEIGIAYTDPLSEARPGVAYPPNLTPALKTGLGGWSDENVVAAIRSGAHGRSGQLRVMPWAFYRQMTDQDASAIVAYLRSIPPVEHPVPSRVEPGRQAPAPYVYFGVYRSGPSVHSSR
jgi:mono/diheme cytochrome c family protein